MFNFKRLSQDDFIRNYLIFFSSSMLAAFLNYLFHPILGRMLSVADFGEVQAFLALFSQTAIIFSVFSLVTVNISANIEDSDERALIINKLKQISLYFIVFLFLLILIFLTYWQKLFNFTSLYSLIGLVLLLFFTALAVFRNAYLHGRSNFKAISISGLLNAVGRLIFSMLLIYLGLRVGGVISALVIAQILVYFYVFYKTRDDLKIKKAKASALILKKERVKQELQYGLLVLLVTGAITFFYNSDILMVKKFFSSEIAGSYSGISVIAKIIFFATGSIAGVLLPTVKIKAGASANKLFLLKSLFILTLVGGGILIFFYLFPQFVIKLLLGSRYLTFASFLPKLGLVMFLFSIINLLFYYFLALRRYFLITIASLGIFLLLCLSYFFNKDINQIINNYLVCAFFIIIYLLLYYLGNNFLKFFRKKGEIWQN